MASVRVNCQVASVRVDCQVASVRVNCQVASVKVDCQVVCGICHQGDGQVVSVEGVWHVPTGMVGWHMSQGTVR